jgi:hypothetical protein
MNTPAAFLPTCAWIDPIVELEKRPMHPLVFLFEEINRDWGLPQRNRASDRKQGFRWRDRRTRNPPERN